MAITNLNYNSFEKLRNRESNIRFKHRNDVSLRTQNINSKSLSSPLTFLPQNIISFKSSLFKNFIENSQEGYQKEKNYIINTLISPIKNKKEDNQTLVPPVFLIHACDETVKRNIKEGIIKELEKDCEILNFNNEINPKDFITELNKQIENSKMNYLQNSKRTLLFVDNIEKFIDSNSTENTTSLKSIADYCSKLPKSENESNAGLTIVSFTENPEIIDRELLFRPEKIYSVAFTPLQADAISEILKKEVNRQEQFFCSLKTKKSDDLKKMDLPYYSWKNLQSMKTEGKIGFLTTDCKNIPYETIGFFAAPKLELGAFTYKQIQEITKNSALKYLENPVRNFTSLLCEEFAATKRQITPSNLSNKMK